MSELISRQKLKPCPFCGGKASTTKRERWKDESCTYSRPDYGVSCQECYAKGYQRYSTVEEAIEAWNKRTEPPADVPDTNVGEWVPCIVKLPEKSGEYWVTIIWSNKPTTSTGRYDAEKKMWDRYSYDPIAWKPYTYPEPYKGE